VDSLQPSRGVWGHALPENLYSDIESGIFKAQNCFAKERYAVREISLAAVHANFVFLKLSI